MGTPRDRSSSGDARLAAIYIRVSSKEQVEGYSLDAQLRVCREFCAARGYTVVVEYHDEGVSAHTENLAKRPGFARMLADAEDGRFGVVVVHKMDRFARKLRVTLESLERLGRAQVGFVSVSEPDLDYSTPQGFLFLVMLGGLAEWFSRNLSTETKKGWRERKAQGLYAGRLPFGAIKGPDGVPVPDTRVVVVNGQVTTNQAGLELAFERAAEGATDAEVAEALNAAGYRPSPHARRARFTRDATRATLINRFYVGELPIGKRGVGGWMKGAHASLIQNDLFESVQRQRAHRTTQANPSKVNRGAQKHALSGLVKCADCGESMHLEGAQRLNCWGRRQVQGCRAPSVAATVIEDEIGQFLQELCFPDDTQQCILRAYRESKPAAVAAEQHRQALEGQLRRLGDLFVLGDLEKGEYEARRSKLRSELNRVQETEVHGRPEVLGRLQHYLVNAGAAWHDADAEQRNRLARALFDAVMVRNQHVVGIRPRQEFQPYFALLETTAPTPSKESRRCQAKERGGGPEGIRTPDLVLDRDACLATTPRDPGRSARLM
jgi:site-specific DNA recombinase